MLGNVGATVDVVDVVGVVERAASRIAVARMSIGPSARRPGSPAASSSAEGGRLSVRAGVRSRLLTEMPTPSPTAATASPQAARQATTERHPATSSALPMARPPARATHHRPVLPDWPTLRLDASPPQCGSSQRAPPSAKPQIITASVTGARSTRQASYTRVHNAKARTARSRIASAIWLDASAV